jgi:hypothetical protein
VKVGVPAAVFAHQSAWDSSLPASGEHRAGRRAPRRFGLRRTGLRTRAATGVLLVLALTLPVAAQGRPLGNPSLDVTFSASGAISVSLPDGTPVGSASGVPTLIPAGYYTVLLTGPGECVQVPLFNLKGPGENLQSDMSGGEVNTEVYSAYLAPNSTYTWNDYATPTVFYAFTTSASVLGTPLGSGATAASGASSVAGTTPSNENVVGSGLASGALPATPPFRGALSAAVSAKGKLSLTRGGKNVGSLIAGRYTISVTDRSPTSGFMLENAKHQAVTLARKGFAGARSLSVDLTAGQWFFASHLPGKETFFFVEA